MGNASWQRRASLPWRYPRSNKHHLDSAACVPSDAAACARSDSRSSYSACASCTHPHCKACTAASPRWHQGTVAPRSEALTDTQAASRRQRQKPNRRRLTGVVLRESGTLVRHRRAYSILPPPRPSPFYCIAPCQFGKLAIFFFPG
jgi:hypothetical protein